MGDKRKSILQSELEALPYTRDVMYAATPDVTQTNKGTLEYNSVSKDVRRAFEAIKEQNDGEIELEDSPIVYRVIFEFPSESDSSFEEMVGAVENILSKYKQATITYTDSGTNEHASEDTMAVRPSAGILQV